MPVLFVDVGVDKLRRGHIGHVGIRKAANKLATSASVLPHGETHSDKSCGLSESEQNGGKNHESRDFSLGTESDSSEFSTYSAVTNLIFVQSKIVRHNAEP